MIKLGGVVPEVARLGAARPSTLEISQVPFGLCVKQPKEIPFDFNLAPPCGIVQLLPGGAASRSACRSAVIWRANISTKPDPFMPMVFLSFVALSMETG